MMQTKRKVSIFDNIGGAGGSTSLALQSGENVNLAAIELVVHLESPGSTPGVHLPNGIGD
jgi:hypothetical protein